MRRGVLAAALLSACAAAPSSSGLSVTGVLDGPARGSLGARAEWVVEVRDAADARVLAEARGAVAAQSPPIAFALTVPADALRGARAPQLRGAVTAPGLVTWLTAPQPIPPHARESFDAGSLRLEPQVHPGGFASTLDCGGRRVTIGFVGAQLRLSDGALVVDLDAVPAALPTRFARAGQPSTFVQIDDAEVTVSVRGRLYPRCVAVPPR